MTERGYTLIEVAVVVVLIGLMLGLAVPKVHDALSGDLLKSATRKLIGTSRELRSDAVRNQINYELHIDLDLQSLWICRSDTTAEKRAEIKGWAQQVPDGVQIKDAYIYGGDKKTQGETVIQFFKKGYMQPAVIHLAYAGKDMTLVFDPFVSAVKTYDEYRDMWQKTSQ
jgi:prepilin-type N-terminal cleavage/methylation domain-containing protein